MRMECEDSCCFPVILLLLCFFKDVLGQGGAGPLGSISDYYDHAFGNPFLGYWKNPGNKNPYGSHNMAYGASGSYPGYGGTGANMYGPTGNLYGGYPGYYGNSADRPGSIAPSYVQDRYPNVYDRPYIGNNNLHGGAYGGAGGLGNSGYNPGYGSFYGAGAGGYGPGYGYGYGTGGGYPGAVVDSRTPADRALQDLLPSTYASKPWYP